MPDLDPLEHGRLVYFAQLLAYARDETERAAFAAECQEALDALDPPDLPEFEPIPDPVIRRGKDSLRRRRDFDPLQQSPDLARVEFRSDPTAPVDEDPHFALRVGAGGEALPPSVNHPDPEDCECLLWDFGRRTLHDCGVAHHPHCPHAASSLSRDPTPNAAVISTDLNAASTVNPLMAQFEKARQEVQAWPEWMKHEAKVAPLDPSPDLTDAQAEANHAAEEADAERLAVPPAWRGVYAAAEQRQAEERRARAGGEGGR